jgi:hypothetical protein
MRWTLVDVERPDRLRPQRRRPNTDRPAGTVARTFADLVEQLNPHATALADTRARRVLAGSDAG